MKRTVGDEEAVSAHIAPLLRKYLGHFYHRERRVYYLFRLGLLLNLLRLSMCFDHSLAPVTQSKWYKKDKLYSVMHPPWN